MGSARAGKWIIGLLIYFFVFVIIVTSASNMDNDISSTGGEFADKETPFNSPYCDGQRTKIIFQSDDSYDIIDNYNEDDTDCSLTTGVVDQDICEYIEGCSWENVTITHWFSADESSFTCNGTVNTTYYNDDENFTGYSLCEMTGLDNNLDCSILGCFWYNENTATNLNLDSTWSNVNSIASTIGGLFLFRVDLGMPEQAKTIFIFILFYIPFFILLMAIYFILPFIH